MKIKEGTGAVVEHFANMHKAMVLTPSTGKKKWGQGGRK
jgi:hypothetical protein